MVGKTAIAVFDLGLNRNGAAHRLHGAGELGDDAVTSAAEDATTMVRD